MAKRTLIFIPTYNECENVENMCRELLALGLDADIVFLDDNSPDGTGQIIDRLAATHPRVSAMHRTGKLGIGTAHQAGIARAYEQGYDQLITMDCDFTHSPSDLPRLMAESEAFPVVVGSRYMRSGSLPGWNLMRRSLTNLGHFLTKRLLAMPEDATGALRVYDLTKVPHGLFKMVQSGGYSFFFESLFLLVQNGYTVKELPIVLPARTYGHSKMSYKEAFKSARQLFSLYAAKVSNPHRFKYVQPKYEVDPALHDPQGWDEYWKAKARTSTFAYEVAAAVYRRLILQGQLSRAIHRNYAKGAKLLHAGCGSGQVDQPLHGEFEIHALDVSAPALSLYQRNNPSAQYLKHGTIFALPFETGTFDGVYNLGVMEHFTSDEIVAIFKELSRVLRPSGRLVIFWPHRFASSVLFLNSVHFVLNKVMKRGVTLHPAEISLLRNREHVQELLRRAGLRMTDCRMTPRDGFVQAVVVADKHL